MPTPTVGLNRKGEVKVESREPVVRPRARPPGRHRCRGLLAPEG